MFPPGRARLATKPAATGSAPVAAITIGIVAVASFAAWTIVAPLATITSTRRRTRSAASSPKLSRFFSGPASLEDDVLAFYPSQLTQAVPESIQVLFAKRIVRRSAG
jgi:hypothetical protein